MNPTNYLYYDGETIPFRNAVVECTHCQHSVRLVDVPIKNMPAPLELELLSPTSLSEEDVLQSPVDNSPDTYVLTDSEDNIKLEECEGFSGYANGTEEKKWRWSQDLKEHFVRAFDALQDRGIHATPKKIMSLMRANGAPIEQLTMRRVQSHHQKYLKRQKSAKAGKKSRASRAAAAAAKTSEPSSKIASQSFDSEVSFLSSSNNFETQSCHSSPRGSPMMFNNSSTVVTAVTSAPYTTSSNANSNVSVTNNNSTTINVNVSNVMAANNVPLNFLGHQQNKNNYLNELVRPQPSFLQQQQHMLAQAARHQQLPKYQSSPVGPLVASNPAMWQYMMSNTVIKPTEPAALTNPLPAALNNVPFVVSSSSAFGTRSLSFNQFNNIKMELEVPSGDMFEELLPFQQTVDLVQQPLNASMLRMEELFPVAASSSYSSEEEEANNFNIYDFITQTVA